MMKASSETRRPRVLQYERSFNDCLATRIAKHDRPVPASSDRK